MDVDAHTCCRSARPIIVVACSGLVDVVYMIVHTLSVSQSVRAARKIWLSRSTLSQQLLVCHWDVDARTRCRSARPIISVACSGLVGVVFMIGHTL